MINVGYVLYYELNIDYIVETYCINTDKPELKCNGKCFLTKQLNLQSQEDTTDQKSNLRIVEAFYPLYYETASVVEVGIRITVFKKSAFPPFLRKVAYFQEAIEEPPQLLI